MDKSITVSLMKAVKGCQNAGLCEFESVGLPCVESVGLPCVTVHIPVFGYLSPVTIIGDSVWWSVT